MSRADTGALMRYADELVDRRVLSPGTIATLQRLMFRYRRKGGPAACVGLDELAGDGIAKGTTIKYLRELEDAHLIVKEKWGIVRNGRWCQKPNRYHLRTAEEARTAAIDAAEKLCEPELEYELFTICRSPSESKICTVPPVILKESSTFLRSLLLREEEDAHQGRRTPVDSAVAGSDTRGTSDPAEDIRRPAAIEPGRSEADSRRGGIPDGDDPADPKMPGECSAIPGTVGHHQPDLEQAGDRVVRAGDGDRRLNEDPLMAQQAALEAHLLGPKGKALCPTSEAQRTPREALAARAKTVQDRLLEAHRQRMLNKAAG